MPSSFDQAFSEVSSFLTKNQKPKTKNRKPKTENRKPKTALKAVADGKVDLIGPVPVIIEAVYRKRYVNPDGPDGG